jgi:RHS repeat-associated protein
MTYSTFGYCGYLDNLTLLGTIDLLNIEKDKIIGQPSGITITKTYSCDAIVRKTSESVQQRKSSTDRSLLNINASNEYDARDRVTKLTDSLGNESIKLSDGNGLLWSVSHRYKKADGTYLICSNRLQDIRIGSVAGTLEASFFHNDEGRLTNQTGPNAKALTWDAKGRVKAVSGETYTYDPMDYRIGRTGGSVGAREYFLEGERLESEYSGTSLQAKYFRGSTVDELVGAWMTDADGKLKPFLFHQDQVTSTSAVTGHNGGTTQSVKYAAFGTVQSSTGASPNRNKYTGREDDGTGLMYYRARYYDSSVGRFISEDPMGYAAGINFYAYANNNPVNANDPSGLDANVPYLNQDAARIAAGLYVGARTLYDPGSRESGVYTYQLGSNWYHTPAVTSTGKINQISSPDWGFALQFVPRGASNVEQMHSHPPESLGYKQTPSLADYVGSANSPTRSSGLGLTDGSVFTFAGRKIIQQGDQIGVRPTTEAQAAVTLTRLAGPSPLSNIYLDREEPPPIPSLGTSSSYGGDASAAGGFLLYPNKSNTNSMRSVYSK